LEAGPYGCRSKNGLVDPYSAGFCTILKFEARVGVATTCAQILPDCSEFDGATRSNQWSTAHGASGH
jgi:hypothetical protein